MSLGSAEVKSVREISNTAIHHTRSMLDFPYNAEPLTAIKYKHTITEGMLPLFKQCEIHWFT
jgi:hypothetical protein